jgi:hypothetical protein
MIKSYNNLKRKIIIALFLVFTISVNFVLFSHLIDQSNSSIKDQEKNFELYNLKVSGQEINITSPENKTYTRPMGGYYPATYGFENDIISAPPQGLSSEVGTGTIIEVIDQLDGHNMITRLYDGAIGENNYANLSHTFSPKSTGVIEFWFRRSGIQEVIFFELWNETNYGLTIYSEDWSGGLAFEYYNGTDYVTIMSHNSDQWYHHRLDFDCINGTFDWYIDGVLRGDDLLLRDPTPYFVRFTVRTRGWGSTGYNAYIDGLGISWDINYNIGDNLNEGLLLSYDNSTNLDWQGYSLDGQPNKTILGNTAIPMPDYGVHNIQVFGNDSIGTIHESDIRYFSIKHINIVTPENKTYTSSMNGYYPATYGFEDDSIDANPIGWTVTEPAGTSVGVIENIASHRNVVELSDFSGSNYGQIENIFSNQVNGTVEFWYRKTSTTDASYIIIGDGDTLNSIFIRVHENGWFRYYTTVYNDIQTYSANSWYHIIIDFDSADQWYIWINDVKYGPYDYRGTPIAMDRVQFQTSSSDVDFQVYVDAVGYSWDTDYNIGDNLDEGLLISFENSTALDWIGYSLDDQANRTITGNTTFSVPDDGLHKIQVFGNNSLGTMYSSEMRYFSINLLPLININLPTQNDVIGPSAPYFNISIIESNLNETWYTLDNGASNITFTGLTGIINQIEWDKQIDGPVTIRFYANDTSGLENFEEVIVFKDTSVPIISIISPNTDDFFAENPPGFDITIVELSLNTTWYTLDNGVSNITFTGLIGTISQIEWDGQGEGSITIRFYANDTFGNKNYAEISIFKDITDPVITIHSPSIGEGFTVIPPAFNISVDELNFDSMWYTTDGGLSNYSNTQFTGDVDSTAWNAAPTGAITIRFYAKDSAGNIGYADVVVQKNIPPPPLDINLIIIIVMIISIIGIVVVSVFVYNKKHVRIKKPKLKVEKIEKVEEKKKARKKRRKGKIAEPQIINCPFCQNKITLDQKYCKFCGANLRT